MIRTREVALSLSSTSGTLSAPQRVQLQPTNPVGINVIWTRPETEKEIDSYTVSTIVSCIRPPYLYYEISVCA